MQDSPESSAIIFGLESTLQAVLTKHAIHGANKKMNKDCTATPAAFQEAAGCLRPLLRTYMHLRKAHGRLLHLSQKRLTESTETVGLKACTGVLSTEDLERSLTELRKPWSKFRKPLAPTLWTVFLPQTSHNHRTEKKHYHEMSGSLMPFANRS